MPQPQTVTIQPPLAGIQRATGFQEEPPYSCYDSINMVPFDALDGHAASATRPPLSAFATPGVNVNLLAQLNLPAPTAFAAANGKLYKHDGVSTWNAISSSYGITTGRFVSSTPFVKKLFIANDTTPVTYDDATGLLTPYAATAGLGTLPPDCRVFVTYAGAIWIMGAPASPHIVYSSRIGDPFDWDFSVDESDEGGAFAGTSALFGLINEPIVAAVPLQGRMILAGENSMYLLTGHPRQNGTLELLSSSIGILGQQAWCHVPGTTDEIFFWSKNGIHRMQTESLRHDLVATPVSKTALPDELIGSTFDSLDPTACLRYDTRWGGIVITDREAEIAFWYDLKNGGFFRMRFANYPTVLFHFDNFLTADASGLLFGGNGYGGLARFDRLGSETFDSSQLIGPVKISSSPLYQSLIQRMAVILGGGSNDLTGVLALYTANTAQSSLLRARADERSYKFDVTIEDLIGNGKTAYPRLSGHAVTVKWTASGVAGKRMVFEGLEAEIMPAGRNKDLGLLAPVVTVPSGVISLPTS